MSENTYDFDYFKNEQQHTGAFFKAQREKFEAENDLHSLKGLLALIKKNPFLVLGVKSLDSLFYFIVGYTCRAEFENELYSDCLDGFEEFVHGYYNSNNANNWHGLIKTNTASQEEAFDIFYKLFELHLAKKENV